MIHPAFYYRALCILALFAVLRLETAQAQSNILLNASFETPGLNRLLFGCALNDVPIWSFGPNGATRCVDSRCPDGNSRLTFFPFLAQEVETVPGRKYYLKFAAQTNGLTVRFGNDVVNTFTNIGGTNYYFNSPWFYSFCHVTAVSNRTWLRFESPSEFAIDDVSLGWLDEPLTITRQPTHTEVLLGGRATLEVGVSGVPPVSFQWFKDSNPMAGMIGRVIYVNDVKPGDAGDYFVVVSNHVRVVTSSTARVTVDASPRPPQIVYHPESFNYLAGAYVSVRVAAIGTPPLKYQWRFQGTNLLDATNSFLPLAPLGLQHAGSYEVRVENQHGSALSLPAVISVTASADLGYILISNLKGGIKNPVYDVDGTNKVSGEQFSYQTYCGVTPDRMIPIGNPAPFRTGSAVGYILPATLTIPFPELAFDRKVYVQLRAWESAFGSSYEQARAQGGKFGGSPMIYTNATPPPPIGGVPVEVYPASFNLRAGLPGFTTGRLSRGDRLPGGQIEWLLTGAPGFTYLVERRQPPNDWIPLLVLTNGSGTATFSDPNQLNASVKFYRARMLD